MGVLKSYINICIHDYHALSCIHILKTDLPIEIDWNYSNYSEWSQIFWWRASSQWQSHQCFQGLLRFFRRDIHLWLRTVKMLRVRVRWWLDRVACCYDMITTYNYYTRWRNQWLSSQSLGLPMTDPPVSSTSQKEFSSLWQCQQNRYLKESLPQSTASDV